MAYKFQLGAARLSGSLTQEGDITVEDGGITIPNGSTIGPAAVDDLITLSSDGDLTFKDGAYDFDIASHDATNGLKLGGTLVTSTAAELNLLDGSGADTIVNSKAVIYGSAGEVNASTFHISGQEVIDGSGNAALGNVEVDGYVSASSYVSASALDIENGAQIGGNIDSSGDLTVATITMTGFSVDADGDTALKSLAIDDSSTIGCDSDTDLMTLSSGLVVVAGEMQVTTLDIGGTNVTSTAAELNLLDGAAADTVVNSKAVIYGSAGEVNATSYDISGTEVISSGGNLFVNAIEFDGNIDIASAGAFSLGASMGANTMTLGGSTSTVRVAGDLEVVGTLNRVTETELLIEDKAVVVASGSANAAAAAGAGLVVDIATGDMTFLYQANGENVGGVDASASGDIFVASGSAGLIDVQAAAFYGDGSNLTNVNASGLEETVQTLSSTGTISLASGLQVLADASGGSITLTLPSAGSVEGKMLKIKRSEGSANTVTIDTSAGTIDGESSIILESAFAGVSIISDGTDYYVM